MPRMRSRVDVSKKLVRGVGQGPVANAEPGTGSLYTRGHTKAMGHLQELRPCISDERDEGLSFEWQSTIMKAFFDRHRVVSQNIDSFNKFLNTHIHEIITEEPIICECETVDSFPVRHEVHFQRVNIDAPKRDEGNGGAKVVITPNECLNRSLTYASEVYASGFIQKCELQNGVWVPVPLTDTERKKGGVAEDGQREARLHARNFFVCIGKIPIMVKSQVCYLSQFRNETDFLKRRECPLDPGGYFIISGKERVLVAQEKHPENQAVVYRVMVHNNFECECEIRSSVENSLRPVNLLWIRLMKEKKIKFEKLLRNDAIGTSHDDEAGLNVDALGIEKQVYRWNFVSGKQFVAVIPKLQKPIPITLLLKALGCPGVEEIEAFVVQGDAGSFGNTIRQLLKCSLAMWDFRLTRAEAVIVIGSLTGGNKEVLTRADYLALGREILNDNVLQNIGVGPDSDGEKRKFICEMMRRVCEVHLGVRKHDDRDHLINKRFELAGSLFLQLFKRLWKQLSFLVQKRISKRIEGKDGFLTYDINSIINPSTITQGFSYSISTGNWTDRKGLLPSCGASQELNRCCYVSTLSHLRRVTTPSKLLRNVTARQLHSSNWGMICTNETPEGEPVGLVQNFALSSSITVGSSPAAVYEIARSSGLVPLDKCSPYDIHRSGKVFLNGRWVGVHSEPEELVRILKEQRRSGRMMSEVSIAVTSNPKQAVEIRTDAGRIYRPLLVVQNNELKLTNVKLESLRVGLQRNIDKPYLWTDLLKDGTVEELDTAEIMNSLVAMRVQDLRREGTSFTHCEIHPTMLLGLSASTVPFANHNQAPRNTYQSGMAKQAVGLYATNYQKRSDLLAHVMHYPHRPLMTTFGAELYKLWELPGGQESVVAILCYQGYNQEDSIILNQSSIDRGLLRSSVIQTYMDVENLVSIRKEQDECFERPGKRDVRYLKTEDYNHLDDDGLPLVGTRILEREPVIGKTVDCAGTKRDASITAKLNTRGVVVQAFATTNEDGQRMHKVIVQEVRVPKMGDKLASRHGQKGVIGLTLPQESMPFTREGVVPDIILNPHAIPSRMTIGHVIEALAGKSVCLGGKDRLLDLLNSTAFTQPVTADSFAKFLTPHGYHKYGEEVLYDGISGEKLRATVFMGVNYYQRLRHMIDDKLNIRNRGVVTLLEGQPKRGLTREGAQRFGEMERDCTISHGSAAFLHERLFTVSDAAYYKVCNSCGTLLSIDPYVGASRNNTEGFYKCNVCAAHGDDLSTIALPKAAKLLYQELLSMNIRPRFKMTADFLKKSPYRSVKL